MICILYCKTSTEQRPPTSKVNQTQISSNPWYLVCHFLSCLGTRLHLFSSWHGARYKVALGFHSFAVQLTIEKSRPTLATESAHIRNQLRKFSLLLPLSFSLSSGCFLLFIFRRLAISSFREGAPFAWSMPMSLERFNAVLWYYVLFLLSGDAVFLQLFDLVAIISRVTKAHPTHTHNRRNLDVTSIFVDSRQIDSRNQVFFRTILFQPNRWRRINAFFNANRGPICSIWLNTFLANLACLFQVNVT